MAISRRMGSAALWVWLTLTIVTGCGHSSDERSAAASDDVGNTGAAGRCVAANDCSAGMFCNDYGYCEAYSASDEGSGATATDGGVAALPPEVEVPNDPPASGNRFVYAALPEANAVARIDGATLDVRLTPVGEQPTALHTVPGEDVAVVLNRGSATVSVLRSTADGQQTVDELPVVPGVNALAMAPDGRHAVAFFDATKEDPSAITAGLPLQEVTLLDLTSGAERAINLAVGFRPREVQFAADGTRAFVVAERSVSVIPFAAVTGPTFIPGVPLSSDPLDEPAPSEVQISADGARAFVRLPGEALLRVVQLTDGAIEDLALAGEPTDVDLSEDNTRVLVVLREVSKLLVIDVPADLEDPSGIEEIATGPYTAGQAVLAPDGERALLFTNATDQLVVLDLDLSSGVVAPIAVQKPVRSLVIAPDGLTALVIHSHDDSATELPTGLDEAIARQPGYSLIDLRTRFVKLQTVPVEPGANVFAPDGTAAYLLLNDPDRVVRRVELLDLRSFLVEPLELGSSPLTVGIVPATSQVYVAQSHPLGRVTFIDASTHRQRTLTGFALDNQVIE